MIYDETYINDILEITEIKYTSTLKNCNLKEKDKIKKYDYVNSNDYKANFCVDKDFKVNMNLKNDQKKNDEENNYTITKIKFFLEFCDKNVDKDCI